MVLPGHIPMQNLGKLPPPLPLDLSPRDESEIYVGRTR